MSDLNKLVILTLTKDGPMPCRDLFNNIRQDNPGAVIKGFKSFVRKVAVMPQIERQIVKTTMPPLYFIKR